MKWFSDEYCLICHGLLEPEISWSFLFLYKEKEEICLSCREKLQRLEGETCRLCNRVIEERDLLADNLCFDCVRWEEDPKWGGLLTKNISLFHYNDFLKETIARFKYRGDYLLARAFKNEINKTLKNEIYDFYVPVPLSQERLDERGFNQAEALIREAGLQSTQLLSRIHTEKQSKKSRADRIQLPQVFQIHTEKISMMQGKHILLVDDIYTTGSTLRHAAKILHENGGGKVSSLTIARK